MRVVPSLLLLLVAGCDLAADPCTPDVAAWEDNDGDGYGGASLGKVCALGEGEVSVPQDCDDADDQRNPRVPESCDGVDNNCDGEVDNDTNLRQWWFDGDGDGFGGRYRSELACGEPGAEWVRNADDCDDRDPLVNPDAAEVCGQVDEDCDGYIDEADDSVDPASFSTFHADADGDGHGDPDTTFEGCRLLPGWVIEPNDCDDTKAQVTQWKYWHDTDEDGYGDPAALVEACRNAPAGTVDNDDDCDDQDPDLTWRSDWYTDLDADGFGAGPSEGEACAAPTPFSVREDGDCDDLVADIWPGAPPRCSDGVDQSCVGFDSCPSCQDLLASDLALPSGVYPIHPADGVATDVYCDMETDGGGWTLVASTRNTPLDDAGTDVPHLDLQTLAPSAGHSEIWSGLRSTVVGLGGRSDIRFACKENVNSPFLAVDLSFYDTPWYVELTTGFDVDSCFSEGNGVGAGAPPERRNNLTGALLPAGDQWGSGYLEGEDSCSDSGDFTVDFDDRGADGNAFDGTDWGEDDYQKRCGMGSGNAWFILIR